MTSAARPGCIGASLTMGQAHLSQRTPMPDLPHPPSCRWRPAALALLALQPWLAPTHAVQPEAIPPNPHLSWSLSHETWTLPGQERMGMVGGRVLMDLGPHWKAGVASYGAVEGQRGGFITLGVEAQTRWPLSERQDLTGSLFVGGGGGRDGRTLAGGGLMVRTALGVEHRLGAGHRIGLGLSHVDFPNGSIRSTQPYLSYAYDFPSLIWGGWPALPTGGTPEPGLALPLREQEFAVAARSYRIAAGAMQDNGLKAQHPRMQLLGAEWLSYLDERWFFKLQADGASGGQSAGYMQILLGGGYRLPVSAGQALKLHASLGPAGGGAVDTGGGLLTDLGIGWQVRLRPRQSLELSLSDVRAPGQSFHARSLGLKLVHHLEQPRSEGSPLSAGMLSGLDTERLRLRLVQQTYRGAGADWRCCFANLPVDNLGLQLDYLLSPAEQPRQWFLTGQGIAAYRGEAGAYMTGLVGGGVRQQLAPRWHAEAEALLGAAGGGGLRTGGGLVAQGNVGLSYQLTPQLGVMLSAGHMQALHDRFKARVLGLSLNYHFSSVTRPG